MKHLFANSEDSLSDGETLKAIAKGYYRHAKIRYINGSLYLQLVDCIYELGDSIRAMTDASSLGPPHRLDVYDVANTPPLRFYWDCLKKQCVGDSVGTLYLIQCGHFYKIGITTDLASRFRRYVTECPYENRIVFHVTLPGYDHIEALAKEFFAPKWHRGEWFRLDYSDQRLLWRCVRDWWNPDDFNYPFTEFDA